MNFFVSPVSEVVCFCSFVSLVFCLFVCLFLFFVLFCFVFALPGDLKKKKKKNFHVPLKALMPITFSSPRAQPEVVYFLVSNEGPYFSDCKSKISASNSL